MKHPLHNVKDFRETKKKSWRCFLISISWVLGRGRDDPMFTVNLGRKDAEWHLNALSSTYQSHPPFSALQKTSIAEVLIKQGLSGLSVISESESGTRSLNEQDIQESDLTNQYITRTSTIKAFRIPNLSRFLFNRGWLGVTFSKTFKCVLIEEKLFQLFGGKEHPYTCLFVQNNAHAYFISDF